ncbi:MAG: hypothetical protein MZV63_56230 [Marinilabiliales bacterium]|nr:hypothetical protein [Marinilabiliales bacterium]
MRFPVQVTVLVTVTGFNNIGSFSLTLDYEYAGMHFSLGTKNPLLGGTFSIYDADLGTGWHRITMSWFSMGMTLPDGSSIVDVTFHLRRRVTQPWPGWTTGAVASMPTTISMSLMIPRQAVTISTALCAGSFPILVPSAATAASATGQAGVYYSVAPLAGASGYAWTVPPGAVITGGGGTYWILADYPAGATSGLVTVAGMNLCVTGPASQLTGNRQSAAGSQRRQRHHHTLRHEHIPPRGQRWNRVVRLPLVARISADGSECTGPADRPADFNQRLYGAGDQPCNPMPEFG